MDILWCMDMFLSAHVLDLLLIIFKVHPNILRMRKHFEYSMDDEVTKFILETQNNTLSMYTKCRNKFAFALKYYYLCKYVCLIIVKTNCFKKKETFAVVCFP